MYTRAFSPETRFTPRATSRDVTCTLLFLLYLFLHFFVLPSLFQLFFMLVDNYTVGHVGLITIFACITLLERSTDFSMGIQHSYPDLSTIYTSSCRMLSNVWNMSTLQASKYMYFSINKYQSTNYDSFHHVA